MRSSIIFLSHLVLLVLLGSSVQAMVEEEDKIPEVSFLFVRHGHTPWGREAITLGPQDLELDATGRDQAQKAARYLNTIHTKPLKVISSPLLRAYQTAEEVVKLYDDHPNIQVVDGLKERYYGDYRLVKNLSETPSDAEDLKTFNRRVVVTFSQILSELSDSDHALVVVSHEKVFEALTQLLTGDMYKLDQGGVGIFIPQDHGIKWQVEIPRIQVQQ